MHSFDTFYFTEDWIKSYPFRIIPLGVDVTYDVRNLDGADHHVAIVELRNNNIFKIVFTRNGTEVIGNKKNQQILLMFMSSSVTRNDKNFLLWQFLMVI